MTVQEAQAALEAAARQIHKNAVSPFHIQWEVAPDDMEALDDALDALDAARKAEAETCPACDGDRWKWEGKVKFCPACNGTGRKEE